MGTLSDMIAKQRGVAPTTQEVAHAPEESIPPAAAGESAVRDTVSGVEPDTNAGKSLPVAGASQETEVPKARFRFGGGKGTAVAPSGGVSDEPAGTIAAKPIEAGPAAGPEGDVHSGAADTGSPAGTGLARLAALTDKSGAAIAAGRDGVIHGKPSGDSTVFTLADIEGSEALGEAPESPFAYPDEIPANAPARNLPEDISEQQQSFVMLLDGVYQAVYDPEGFGQHVRSIMQELQEHQEYKKLICDEDVHTLMRGLRESMGMAKIKKQEKSRSPGSGAKGKAPSVRTASVLDAIDDMGFNESDFD